MRLLIVPVNITFFSYFVFGSSYDGEQYDVPRWYFIFLIIYQLSGIVFFLTLVAIYKPFRTYLLEAALQS